MKYRYKTYDKAFAKTKMSPVTFLCMQQLGLFFSDADSTILLPGRSSGLVFSFFFTLFNSNSHSQRLTMAIMLCLKMGKEQCKEIQISQPVKHPVVFVVTKPQI